MIHITINSEVKPFDTAMTIQALLTILNVEPRQVAVEVNRVIIPKSTHAKAMVDDGDVVELVRFIGGG